MIRQEKPKIDFRYFAPLSVSVASLAVQALTLLLYLFGTNVLFEQNVSVWAAVVFIVRLFGVNPATSYRCIVGFIAAIFYFLFLGLMIKDLCVGIRAFLDLKESRFSLKDRKYNSERFAKLMYECFLTFEFFSLYTILIGLSGGVPVLWTTIAVMILTGIVFVGRGGALYVFQFDFIDIKSALPDVLKDSTVFIGLCIFVFLLKRPLIQDFSVGFFMLLNGNLISESSSVGSALDSFYSDLVFPACIFVALALFFVVIHEYLPHCMRKDHILPRIRKNLIFTATLTILTLLLKCAFAGRFDVYLLANWFAVVRETFLPMTILLAVMYGLEKRYRTKRQIS